MTQGPAAAPVTALLGRDGRLLRADEPLLRLQLEAGGEPQGALALPALAALVRLALRLRMPLSRAVELARDDADISLWADLQPHEDGIHLSLVDWQERSRRTQGGIAALRALDRPLAGAVSGWTWQVDENLKFQSPNFDAGQFGHPLPEPGEAFTGYFVLAEGPEPDQHAMPMLEALAHRAGFSDQHVRLRSDKSMTYRLSGMAQFDAEGRFAGYRGFAERVGQQDDGETVDFPPVHQAPEAGPDAPAPAAASASAEIFGPDLGQRLDQALRAPLDRIIGNAETINRRSEGPLRQDYVSYGGDIAAAGRHLLALVDDIAELQTIELPDFRPASEEVDLSELARRAAGLLNIRAEARHVRIQTPGPDETLLACAEYRRVLQILVNLVGNAVRHSPADSTIWLRLDEMDGRACVIVADQGGGIDPADHGRVFERFERLGNTDGEGSGLGLYISRKLARAMGGDLTLDSALGSGARFRLELPAWQVMRNDTRAG